MVIDKYTIGSDPEGFLYDKDNEKFLPACDLIGGSKDEPLKFNEVFAVLEDNVMVEYNIPPSDFGNNLEKDIKYASDFIEEAFFDNDYEIKYVPSVEFTGEDLQTPKAMEFGCLPDMSVWSLEYRDISLAETNLRYAGGHIHFGIKNGMEDEEVVEFVKLFDLAIGVPSVLLDEDEKRRELYGQAGSFRFKPYGFEYRTLSNFWVKKHEELITKQIEMAVDLFNNSINIEKDGDAIQQAINNSDVTKAKTLIDKYGLLV